MTPSRSRRPSASRPATVLAVCVLALTLSARTSPLRLARAGDAPVPPSAGPPKIATWSGYLFRDRVGRLRVGTPVVAMGVVAVAPRIVAGPLRDRLTSWVSSHADDWCFLNYALEAPEGPSKVPAFLVQVRGEVDRDPDASFPGEGSDEPITMTNARLLAVERLDRAWLEAWACVFRERASPWRIARDADTSAAAVRAFAEKAVDALQAMRARPAPDEGVRASVRAVDEGAVVSEAFRRDKERELQRWLVVEDARRGWRLPGLHDLPPLPPDPAQVQAMLLASATRAEFLAAIGRVWTGELGEVQVHCYVRTKGPFGEGVSMHAGTAADVRDAWTDAEYVARRAVTRETLHR